MRKILNLIISLLSFRIYHGRCQLPVYLTNNTMGKNIFLGRSVHVNNCKIGSNTYIGSRCQFRNAKIGKYCSIAQGVALMSGRHPTSVFVSTSPLFYASYSCLGKSFHVDNTFKEYRFTENGFSLEIGNDVWIGSNVTILDGVKIGDGAIIAACSCVTKDVPPYAIVGGVPAKVIKYRFDEFQISALLRIQWWNCNVDQIKEMATKFSNIDEYLAFMHKSDEQ